MLQLTIPGKEYYDEINEIFIYRKDQTVQLEHSLVSISKWESKWNKPFLSKDAKTLEESIDYIRCMVLTQNVDPIYYQSITQDILNQVNEYIEESMTATWFAPSRSRRSNEIVTAEIIYYWMVALNIPFECQKWHLNRLMTLIQVCNIKNAPEKKMARREMMNRNRALNEARKQKMQTKG